MFTTIPVVARTRSVSSSSSSVSISRLFVSKNQSASSAYKFYKLETGRREGRNVSSLSSAAAGTSTPAKPCREKCANVHSSNTCNVGTLGHSLFPSSLRRFATETTSHQNSPTMSINDSDNSQRPIVVIGAGVLGLSSALILQARYPNHKITIVAAELPSLPSTWSSTTNGDTTSAQSANNQKDSRPSADYASMWAGAHYRPIPRSTRQLEEEYAFAVRTHDLMLDIANRYPVNECGVGIMPAVELLEMPSSTDIALKSGEVYAGVGDNFRVLTAEELRRYDQQQQVDDGNDAAVVGEKSSDKGAAKWGCAYMTYCVNVHVYCEWLIRRFVENGGTVIHRRLARLEDAFEVDAAPADAKESSLPPANNLQPIVINCSGRNFDSDPAMKIVRGQTVLVKNEYSKTITRQNADGSWAFLIPRPGGAGTVVGGTKEIGDLETEPRPLARKTLLENAVRYFPDFVDHVDKFEVLTDNVGRRPWREGGLRIEREKLPSGRHVVHGYGAGGRGYELSWGVAEQVAGLVDETMSNSL